MSVPLERAEKTFHTFMIAFIAVFLSVFIILNIFLHFIVIESVKKFHELHMMSAWAR